MEDLLAHIEQQKSKADEEREELLHLKRQYIENLEQVEAERDKIQVQRDRILQKSKEKGRLLLTKVEREASLIIKNLRDVQAEKHMQQGSQAVERARAWLRKTDEELQDSKNTFTIKSGRVPKNH